MKKLGERINKAGMQFGIWFEPEGISEDSDLYRAHPDWAVHIVGRRPDLSRNQLILDISRRDVQDYIIERLGSVLEEAPITYIKWDMNRSICDKYTRSLGADRQGEFSHRFVLGLYRILETLNERFPYILIEGCSGGGGRFDAGMLYYTPQIWCSDNTDAIGRLDIQYGTSFCYPVSAVYSFVTANSPLINVKVHGLKPDAVYRVQLLKNEDTDPWIEQSEFAQDRILSGNALEQAGIVIPGAGKDYQSWQYYISLLKEQE